MELINIKFIIDYARITIKSPVPHRLIRELSIYINPGPTNLEARTHRPIMPGKFDLRTYFTFGRIKKLFVIHQKCAPVKGIDALMEMHDIPFLELQQIGWILENLNSVSSFHFSRIEFRWVFYPGPFETAIDIQFKIVRHFFLQNARKAWHEGSWPRITFYINDGQSDLFSRIYIRPKTPSPNADEYVVVELNAKRRWLQRINLQHPKDFIK